MLQKHGVEYEEREEGQLFCAKNSEEIIRMFQKECDDADVDIISSGHGILVLRRVSMCN